MTEAQVNKAILWLRSLPKPLQDIAKQFPPLCAVRAKAEKSLHYPAPGEIGQVISYHENDNDPKYTLIVSVPGKEGSGECEASWLQVIGYNPEVTQEFVETVIDAPLYHGYIQLTKVVDEGDRSKDTEKTTCGDKR